MVAKQVKSYDFGKIDTGEVFYDPQKLIVVDIAERKAVKGSPRHHVVTSRLTGI